MKRQAEIELAHSNLIPSPLGNNSQDTYLQNKRFSKETINQFKELQGECKICQIIYLEINYPKAIFFALLMTLSVIGLLLLKYFKSLRALMFYTQVPSYQIYRVTHVYVKSFDKNEEISCISQKQFDQTFTKTFEFKHLQYQIVDGQHFPLAINYQKEIDCCFSEIFLSNGLTRGQATKREQYYGRNQHRVQVPGYFQFLFDFMTKPFFIFQYFVSIIYILQSVAIFGVLMIAFGFITTTINYILLRRSYNQIKKTAQKEFPVKVLRNGVLYQIKNIDLVPGDLYQPSQQIPCDSIIVKGDLFVDEASLTGQNVPIAKFKLELQQKCNDPCHWIFQGSKVQTMKSDTFAMAINVGFGSRRGRIIRKILTKIPKQPQFFKKLIYFLIEVLIISIILYFATLDYLLSINIQTIMVIFRFLDFITYSFPAPFPIYFNLTYSFCLVRLHRDGIIGIQAEKTVESGRMKTLCFDKTGTLTQNKMQVDKIFSIKDSKTISIQTDLSKTNLLISGLFACCHSVEMINDIAKGDEIDLQMFIHSRGVIQQSSQPSVIRRIAQQNQSFDILRINQYESKFQSMSVLVRTKDHSNTKYFIFVKGSPEMVHQVSQLKYFNYEKLIKQLSLSGFRSIAFGYKQISEKVAEQMMKAERELFLKQTTILGVITFVNLLKSDAKETIDLLTTNEINTKIITGDNIYLGIQTAIETGMIPEQATVAVIEGKRYNLEQNSISITRLSKNQKGQFQEHQSQSEPFVYKNEPNLFYAIDNDFLRMRGQDFLNHKVKVFARISPQNKALIVRKHKQIYAEQLRARSFFQKHFGECGYKVGMVGDGANDLIAIKQADVGIGIAGADAVYSASFAIKDLMQIDQIIRQAKNAERQIIDIVQYYGVAQLIALSDTLILTKDATYPTSTELIYKNFLITLVLTLLFGLSRPAERMTKYLANTNFMGLQHHLVYWGNAIINTTGLFITYQYYSNTSDFVPNPNPWITFANGPNGLTKSTTIIFLSENLIFILMALFIFRSSPWKQPFYKNKAFTILLIVNIILLIPMYFTTKHLSFLDLQPIAIKQAAVVLGIMLGAVSINGIYNYVIQRKCFHQINYQSQLEQTASVTGKLQQHNNF